MILCMISLLQAGQLRIDMVHNHEDQSLRLHSLRYKQQEVYSVTRLSYLLSNFSIQRDTGEWVELKNQYAYIDEGKRRTRFFLKDVPEGSYKSIRFTLGVAKSN